MIDWEAFWIYTLTFSALVATGLGAPVPEEVPIVFAGAKVGHDSEVTPPAPEEVARYAAHVAAVAGGVAPDATLAATLPWQALADLAERPPPEPTQAPNRLRWWIMLPLCILGVVFSDTLLYVIGRFGGRRLLENGLVARLLKPEKFARIEENFHKYGVWVLLFARFLPSIRSPIFITAGVLRLPLPRFILADGLYAIPGVSLLFWLAWWFGDQFRELIVRAEGQVAKLRPLIILLVIAGIAGFLLHRFWRKPVAEGAPEELPVIGERVAEKIEHAHEAHAHDAPAQTVKVELDGRAAPMLSRARSEEGAE